MTRLSIFTTSYNICTSILCAHGYTHDISRRILRCCASVANSSWLHTVAKTLAQFIHLSMQFFIFCHMHPPKELYGSGKSASAKENQHNFLHRYVDWGEDVANETTCSDQSSLVLRDGRTTCWVDGGVCPKRSAFLMSSTMFIISVFGCLDGTMNYVQKYAFRCGRNHVIKTIYRSVLIATCCFNVCSSSILSLTQLHVLMMLKTTLTGDRASFSLSFSVVQSDQSCKA